MSEIPGGTCPQTPLDGVLSLMGGYTAPPDFQNSNFAPLLKIFLDETLVCYIHIDEVMVEKTWLSLAAFLLQHFK